MRRSRRIFPHTGKADSPTGDEGVATTFLRRGVAATLEPASEFRLKTNFTGASFDPAVFYGITQR